MNDLRTLIDVSAGTRLPNYEPEIFSDVELTEYYLRKLCCDEWWYDSGYAVPNMAYCYAMTVMKCRWPEAEHIIAPNPGAAYYYAKFVMESRWPEAEHVIATNDTYHGLYNQIFGTNI